MNLRFLEEEIAKEESQILRAGLKSSVREIDSETEFEKMVLDENVCDAQGNVSREFVAELRRLIREYGK